MKILEFTYIARILYTYYRFKKLKNNNLNVVLVKHSSKLTTENKI